MMPIVPIFWIAYINVGVKRLMLLFGVEIAVFLLYGVTTSLDHLATLSSDRLLPWPSYVLLLPTNTA